MPLQYLHCMHGKEIQHIPANNFTRDGPLWLCEIACCYKPESFAVVEKVI